MNLGQIEARTQIGALLAAHVHHGDAGDVEAMVGLYVAAGTYELPNGVRLEGVDQMRETLGQSASQSSSDGWGLAYMRHHLTTSHLEVTSETEAHSDCYFVNVNNRGLDHWGRWRDTFTRLADGTWRFSSRQVIVEGSVEGSWFRTASGLARS